MTSLFLWDVRTYVWISVHVHMLTYCKGVNTEQRKYQIRGRQFYFFTSMATLQSIWACYTYVCAFVHMYVCTYACRTLLIP